MGVLSEAERLSPVAAWMVKRSPLRTPTLATVSGALTVTPAAVSTEVPMVLPGVAPAATSTVISSLSAVALSTGKLNPVKVTVVPPPVKSPSPPS